MTNNRADAKAKHEPATTAADLDNQHDDNPDDSHHRPTWTTKHQPGQLPEVQADRHHRHPALIARKAHPSPRPGHCLLITATLYPKVTPAKKRTLEASHHTGRTSTRPPGQLPEVQADRHHRYPALRVSVAILARGRATAC